jgi:hypothetical protein
MLLLGVDGVEGSNNGVKLREARLLALYIASSAASRMTLSLKRAANITCSSLENCFFLILSGRVRNHEASLDEIDCCLARLRKRRDEEDVLRRGSISGMLIPRRSAKEDFRWDWMGSSFRALDREFCANLSRSKVEKYCKTRGQREHPGAVGADTSRAREEKRREERN